MRVLAGGETDLARRLVHPEFVNHEAAAERRSGPDGAAATSEWLRSCFGELAYEIHHIFVDGDMTAAYVTMSGTHEGGLPPGVPATHKPFAVEHVHLIRFAEDGRALEHSAVRDDLGMVMQLGLLPPPPAGGPDRPATAPVVVSLPIADRRTSHAFYSRLLGLEALGEPVQDGVPEPLQFALNDGMRLLMAPTGGFASVIGGREVAQPGQSELVLSLGADTDAGVDALVDRAREAGAEVIDRARSAAVGLRGHLRRPRRPRLDDHLGAASRLTTSGCHGEGPDPVIALRHPAVPPCRHARRRRRTDRALPARAATAVRDRLSHARQRR